MQEDWLTCLDEQNVQYVLLDLNLDEEFVKTLQRQPQWLVDFEEDGTVIFARKREMEGRGNA